MKFSEMPYQRPNLDEIKAQFAAVTQRFAAAPDYAAAKAAFLDEQTLNKHVDTLANLASIRNTIDTRDEFYDDEMNFWNAATPQIQECQNTWSAALLASPYRKQLGEEYGELMFLNAEIAQKAFSPEILDEMAQENDLSTQYGKLIASAQIPFEGGVQMLPQRRTAVQPLPQLVRDAVHHVLCFPQRADRHLGNYGMVGCFPHATYPLSGQYARRGRVYS